jgi:RNA polymerase nonessential primary-like sigma factor
MNREFKHEGELDESRRHHNDLSPREFPSDGSIFSEKANSSNHDEIADSEKRIMLAYSRDISQHSLLSPEEEYELGVLIQMGDRDALNRMVEANLRLVINIASRYRNRGVDLVDMISEGNLGLIRAAEKYNPHLGYRFSTYATFWIKQFIERGIMNTSRLIRLPVHVIKELNQVLTTQKELNKKYKSRIIKVDDIAEHLNKSVERVTELLTINDCLTYAESLLQQEDDEQRTNEKTRLKDVSQEPDIKIEEASAKKALDLWLDTIDPDCQVILSMRYGLRGHDITPMNVISNMLGITVDDVRRLQRKGLKELRIIAQKSNADLSDFIAG